MFHSKDSPVVNIGEGTHSSILAWRILQTEAGYSQWGLKESDLTETTEHTCTIVAINKQQQQQQNRGRVSDGIGEFNLKASP